MPTIGSEQEGDVSLYFHIPFCSKKCPYCHFFVLPNKDTFKDPFLPALIKEWQLKLPQLKGKRIVSIYFGGGTPTKLPPSAYEILLSHIRRSGITVAEECEITLEANPEDVSLSLMQQFHRLGINRVSLGIQSLLDSELVLLGRTHTVHRSHSAIEATYQAGITNISIDILFELPKQTLSSFQSSLAFLKELPITHLSLYNLTFEPHTVFFKKKEELIPLLPSDPDKLEMLSLAVETLESIGLKRYEISAFSRPGYASVHNTGYWKGRPFLGFGPSAFSYWEGRRFSNTIPFSAYLDQLDLGIFPTGFEEKLPYPANLHELFAVQLRLIRGISLSTFVSRYGPLPPVLKEKLDALTEQGWLEQELDTVRLTPKGRLFYDSVATDLICDPVP